MKYFIIITLLLNTSIVFSKTCLSIKLPQSNQYEFHPNIFISTHDGINISANLLTPKSKHDEKFPTIIFANSWLLDKHQYLVQAMKLVKKGYQVLSYSARGWACSGGHVEVLSQNDMQDVTTIIDWLEFNTNIDMENIGFSGISYGGGMSLMAAAHEKRIKTVVAMSTWGSLSDALFANNTPRMFWGSVLVLTGEIIGNLDPTIREMLKNLIFFKNTEQTIKWAERRSAESYIHLINERNVPIYIANNFGDNLFAPNNVLRFFTKLTGPKRLDLNQGAHATGEGLGLIGLNNYTWTKANEWFDHYLLNKVSTELERNDTIMTVQTDLKHEREEYFSDKLNSKYQTMFLGNESLFKHGELKLTKATSDLKIPLLGNTESLATTGIPLISAVLDGNVKLPVYTYLSRIRRTNAVLFHGQRYKKKMKLRGTTRMSLTINSASKDAQVVVYLYDTTPYGIGKLITHGVYTLRSKAPLYKQEVNFDLISAAYDIPKGNHLTMAIDTFDSLYAPPRLAPYTLSIDLGKSQKNLIHIPIQ